MGLRLKLKEPCTISSAGNIILSYTKSVLTYQVGVGGGIH